MHLLCSHCLRKYSNKTGSTNNCLKHTKTGTKLANNETIFFRVYTVIANATKCKAGGYLHTPNNFKWTNVIMITVSKLRSPTTEYLLGVNMSLVGHEAPENIHSNAICIPLQLLHGLIR